MHCIAVAGVGWGCGAQESEIRVFRMLPAAAPASSMVKKDGTIVAALFGPPVALEAARYTTAFICGAPVPFGQLRQQRLLRDPHELSVSLEVHSQKLCHGQGLGAHSS